MSAEGLKSALAGLDAYWADRDSTWAAGLRPGLSQEAIVKAESLLKPMLLTGEHRVLYGWHDGDGDRQAFGDDWPPFLPLAEAIEHWRFGHTELGWTPCWLPFLNIGQDYRITLIDSVHQDSAGILDFFLQAEPEPWVPSIEAFVRWHLDCLTEGLPARANDYFDTDRRVAIQRFRERYNGPILVRGQPIQPGISATFTHDWPSPWKEAAGIDAEGEVPLGGTTTIANLLSREAIDGVVQGRVTWLGGGIDSSIVQIDDGTGRLLIACPRGTPGVRELGMEFVVEITVKPRSGPIGEDVAFLESVMGRTSFVAESVRFVRSLREEDLGQSTGQ
jgi:hypothetical protein